MTEYDDVEIEKRKKLNFTEVEKLAQPLECKLNGALVGEYAFDRYGMAIVLKKYADLPYDYKIHAMLEHGIIVTDYVGSTFIAHESLPSVVASKFRVSVLEKEKNYNGAYTIGPYIHYADSLLLKNDLKLEKERLGRTLLVFPSHSVNDARVQFDYNHFINIIKKYSKNFDSVRVCMYYEDILLNNHLIYEKEGFEIVTAGHFNDYNFLSRLKSIIETSDMVISNDLGTNLGYAIYLQKPYFLIKSELTYKEGRGKDTKKALEDIADARKTFIHENISKLENVFSNYEEKINKEQKELIGYLWGFNQVKSKDELKNMFKEINSKYSPIKYYLSGIKRFIDIKRSNI